MYNNEYATVRIKEITIDNFKAVKHGKIRFNCAKKFVPTGTESDIAGIYGQNGSGKSALIDILKIVKFLLSGQCIPLDYLHCVSVITGVSDIEICFDMQWSDGTVADAVYSFELIRNFDGRELQQPECLGMSTSLGLFLFEEELSYRLLIPTKVKKKTLLLHSLDLFQQQKSKNSLKLLYDIESGKVDCKSLSDAGIESFNNCKSYVFSDRVCEQISYKDSIEASIIYSLSNFARNHFTVIDTKSYGDVQSKNLISLYMGNGETIDLEPEGFYLSEENFLFVQEKIFAMSTIVSAIIPGLKLFLIEKEKINEDTVLAQVMGCRTYSDGEEAIMPLRYESDGVKRIVSFVFAFTEAFNNKSTTLVVDEIDSGIYEYLLGELLKAFEEEGSGQLIFTSHNLRPLEVINNNSIYFTTSNPSDRYMQIKNVRPSNNLRSMYFREIITNATQKDELYSPTKRVRIESAMRRAGLRNGKT